MDGKAIKSILEVGETIAVEFKRCGSGIENDETIQAPTDAPIPIAVLKNET